MRLGPDPLMGFIRWGRKLIVLLIDVTLEIQVNMYTQLDF